MKKLSLIVIIMASLALGGCADMSDTEQRTLSGAAIGTAAGRQRYAGIWNLILVKSRS